LRLNILKQEDLNDLKNHLNQMSQHQFHAINNGSIVNYFINNVIENSSVENGIGLSDEAFLIMKEIMKFNYQNIYLIKRVKVHEKYVSLILESIFSFLYDYSMQDNMILALENDKNQYPKLITHYLKWLDKYAVMNNSTRKKEYKNKIVYDFVNDSHAVEKSIIDYLAGMSDVFIVQAFNELISF
ncbi:MAG: metal-dependent phosphohydrolase, partial [Coprobacillus sp.]